VHPPPWQASPPVQALPSSRGVVSSAAMPVHTPLWRVDRVVQAFPSSHGVLSGSGVRAETPPSQVSLLVQEFLSSHAAPSSSAALPTQVPFWQVSAAVQALPSSQGVPFGWGASCGQYTLVPVQVSAASQMSAAPWQTVPALAGG